MALTLTPKPSSATYRYTWLPPLSDGDSLAEATLSVSSGTAEIDDYAIDGEGVVFAVSGGTEGAVTVITAWVDTADGETLLETIYLPINPSEAQAVTARDVCAFALRKIVGVGNEADAAELDDALELLNGFLAMQRGKGVELGVVVPLEASTELNIPDDRVLALKYILRRLAHSTYEAPLNPADLQMAQDGDRMLSNLAFSPSDLSVSTTISRPNESVADLF